MVLAGELFNGSGDKGKSTVHLSFRERFIAGQCRSAFSEEKTGKPESFPARMALAVWRRISALIFLFLMTDDRESRWRALSVAAIKPYVWPEEVQLPVNNAVYLFMTQIRWMKMLISGTMKPGGRIQKQHR
jgi:hypothetical protein